MKGKIKVLGLFLINLGLLALCIMLKSIDIGRLKIYINISDIYLIYFLKRSVVIMVIGKGKTRILVNLPIELKEELEQYAKEDNRSLSNYIVNLLIRYKDVERRERLGDSFGDK